MSSQQSPSRAWQLTAIIAVVLAVASIGITLIRTGDDSDQAASSAVVQLPPEKFLMKGAGQQEAAHAPDPNAKVEDYQRPDPTLPKPPSGSVKKFTVDTSERITRVSDEKPGLRVWSYGVNGRMLKGTGASPPIVVDEGDKVRITFRNGSSTAMQVHFPHSFDTHAAEASPQKAFGDVKPGGSLTFEFKADHAGVFMYHCGTKPALRHVGAGMAGAMIVRPTGLQKVDRELWLTQQEFYLGEPNGDASVEKMVAKKPDVIAFNGFASQYLKKPIAVKRGERIRIWVVNAGASFPSYFHVIGSVFDRVWSEGDSRGPAQTMSLGPAEGGFVELTLAAEATYPFVTHAFGDMVRGAIGALRTAKAPAESTSDTTANATGGDGGHEMGGHDMGSMGGHDMGGGH
jgi:nitrite reductase (NO-forming)